MFTGIERYQLDDRLRVPLPPEHREAFKPYGWVITAADDCLEVHTIKTFEAAKDALEAMDDGEDKDFALEDLYSSAHKVTPDSQGRITLPQLTAEWAGLQVKNPVVVAGRGGFLRIWNETRWNARAAQRRNARARAAGRKVLEGEA